VKPVRIPEDLRFEGLRRDHVRRDFRCGEKQVEEWLASKALQHQKKHLSVTKVLVDERGYSMGFYTLATGQVDFNDLPADLAKRLPARSLPVAVLAWLGIHTERQGQGLGRALLAQALRDCFEAGKTFAFIAVILDCLNETAKAFYRQWDFEELPGHTNRLYLSAARLEAMMEDADPS
jgi:GNAT superfamily N-acetyltransferase